MSFRVTGEFRDATARAGDPARARPREAHSPGRNGVAEHPRGTEVERERRAMRTDRHEYRWRARRNQGESLCDAVRAPRARARPGHTAVARTERIIGRAASDGVVTAHGEAVRSI